MHTLQVYNTITKQYETIAVTEEIYNTYRRTEWAIERNDKKIAKNQINFSELFCNYEDFCGSIDYQNDPAQIVEKLDEVQRLYSALLQLELSELELIKAIYYTGYSYNNDGRYNFSIDIELTVREVPQ